MRHIVLLIVCLAASTFVSSVVVANNRPTFKLQIQGPPTCIVDQTSTGSGPTQQVNPEECEDQSDIPAPTTPQPQLPPAEGPITPGTEPGGPGQPGEKPSPQRPSPAPGEEKPSPGIIPGDSVIEDIILALCMAIVVAILFLRSRSYHRLRQRVLNSLPRSPSS